MKKIEIEIDEKLCKGCYFCIEKCPNEVLTKSENLGPKGYLIAKVDDVEKCVGCRICERICPDFAISVKEVEN
jgi:2-oxoglutarate ferredoxin oxidoreductase subunit delta